MESFSSTISVQEICDDIDSGVRNKANPSDPIPPFPHEQSDVLYLNFLFQLKAKEDIVNTDLKEIIPNGIEETKSLINQIEHIFNSN